MPTQDKPPQPLTTAQAARLLGVSEARVRQLADAGQLAIVRGPHGRQYDALSVDAVRAQRAARPETR